MKNVIQQIFEDFLPKTFITYFLGWFANIKSPILAHWLIRHFIRIYHVNMDEALATRPEDYDCFNDFFIRKLQPQARPYQRSLLVSPVDGVISETGKIQKGQLLQAKGKTYTLEQLLDEPSSSIEHYSRGHFTTIYLAPKDYHRIHMPIAGQVKKMVYLPGKLFSVKPSTVQRIPHLFAQNERVAVYLDTAWGEIIMVLVGATIVGKIATSWHGEFQRSSKKQVYQYNKDQMPTLHQADELGYFKLGSTVILILPNQFKIPPEALISVKNSPIRLFQPLIGGSQDTCANGSLHF